VKRQGSIRRLRGLVRWTGDQDESRQGASGPPAEMVIVDTTVWIDYLNGVVIPQMRGSTAKRPASGSGSSTSRSVMSSRA
jgi:hypothetical protein